MTKFLDHKKGEPQPSITQADVDNKMMEGIRPDQRDPANKGRPSLPTPQKVIRLAADLGVDLAHVEATGEDGKQITEEDVHKAAQDPAKKMPSEAVLNDLTGRKDRDKRREQERTQGTVRNAPTNPTPTNPNAPNPSKGSSTPTGGGGNPNV